MASYPRPGFRHRDLIIYAVRYELATFPRSLLIVWLDERGNSLKPWARPAEPHKPMVTVKPGDVIIHNGERLKVAGVSVYRALPVDGGYVGVHAASSTHWQKIEDLEEEIEKLESDLGH